MLVRNTHTRIIFILFITGVISLAEYSIYASFGFVFTSTHPYLFHAFSISLFAFPFLLIGTMIIGFRYFSQILAYLYTISVVWLGFLLYLFLGSLLLALCISLNIPPSIISFSATCIAVLAASLSLYGIWNANTPRTITWQIKSDALRTAWAGKKIILISDTHFGQVRRTRFAQKITERINKEKPDIVFHTGDIIDGPTFPYSLSFTHIEKITPPLGMIYVEGNHERYSQEYDTFRSFFPKNITDVTDKKININDTQIIGLSFKESESKEEIKQRLRAQGYQENIPSIILLHDPKNSGALADLGVSLVLSGHTHGGQFFPSTLIVQRLYKSFAHGITQTKNTTHVTTYGIGTAMIPMRIGTIPEMIILEIM